MKMKKIRYVILSSWDTDIKDEKGNLVKAKGFLFQYENVEMLHTIFIPLKNINENVIKKSIKDYYKEHIKLDPYKDMQGEFDLEEES